MGLNRLIQYLLVFLVGGLGGVGGVYTMSAFEAHQSHSAVESSPPKKTGQLDEAGHGGFAAIQETVRLLESSSGTDWEDVNVARLRKHLVDMHELTVNTTVQRYEVSNGVVFRVRGEGRTIAAIRRMVPRHAIMTLDPMNHWSARTNKIERGIELIVKAEDQRTLRKMTGLGFHGLMATGANHPKHHRMIATGHMEY